MEEENVEEETGDLTLLGKAYKTVCRGIKNVNSEGYKYRYKYRYVLNLKLVKYNNGKKAMFILKNPSTADADDTDPTLEWVGGWANRNNIHNFTVCNIFERTAKKPIELKKLSQNERIGKNNNKEIKKCLEEHDEVIVGWGNPGPLLRKDYNSRIRDVLEFEEIKTKTLFKVGNCPKEEYPRHPLYHWFYKTNIAEKFLFNRQKALDRLKGKYT